MALSGDSIDIYLETGQKRVFAGAVDWPGWCRSGQNEDAVLQALLEYGPRYARVVQRAGIVFIVPRSSSVFQVVERLVGNSATDFGAPGVVPRLDDQPVDEKECSRLRMLLSACWDELEMVLENAAGQELRKGPRGGGRDAVGILKHVLEGGSGYLSHLGWKPVPIDLSDLPTGLRKTRAAMEDGLAAAVRGEIPAYGPRGGKRWPPRYFVRRTAWHILDHAWEIEDRLIELSPGQWEARLT